MDIRKGLRYFVILSLGLVFSLYSVFSFCDTSPQNITVRSGGINVGTFPLGEQIYIKPDLVNNPLTLSFLFYGSEDDCINESDIKYRLSSDLGFRDFDGFSSSQVNENLYMFVASFTINNIRISNSIIPFYEMTTKDGGSGSGSITLLKDDTEPSILVDYTQKDVYGDNKLIEFTIRVEDLGAGLSSLTLQRGETPRHIDYEGNKSVVVVYNDTPRRSKTYIFRAEDVLGNTNEKNVSIVVDDDTPVISDVDDDMRFYNSNRHLDVSARVSDSSVALGKRISVFGDFSEVNPSDNWVRGNCQNSGSSSDSLICSWRIGVSLDETSDVTVRIFAEDEFGHNTSKDKSSNVFIDKEGPEIIEFYLENWLGVRNVLSPEDRNASIVVKFRDASLPDDIEGRMGRDERFGLAGYFPPNPDCDTDGGVVTCAYFLRTAPQAYRGFSSYLDNYSITLYDEFSNSNSRIFSVEVDNVAPVLDRIELEGVGTSIPDRVITSGESIKFTLYINDSNLDNAGEYFVLGNFSSIDFSGDRERVNGSCMALGGISYECSFSGISVENGHFKRNVSFLVFDAAGNGINEMYEVEVFRIGNEVSSSFRIPDLEILNPIHREHIRYKPVKAWFKGNIESEDNSMRIVNYQIDEGSCNTSQLNPLLVIDGPKLFPSEVVYFDEQENVFEFAIESELGAHNGLAFDLNDKEMICTMSILKRDDTTLYEPELVNFSLTYSFYEEYRVGGEVDGLLKAQAEDILSDIKDAEFLGSWFNKTWKVYKFFDNICSAITKASGVVSVVTSTLNGISMGLKGVGVTQGLGISLDQVSMPTQGKLSWLFGTNPFIQKACGYVTCEHGGLLTNRLANTDFGSKVSSGFNRIENACVDLLSSNIDPTVDDSEDG